MLGDTPCMQFAGSNVNLTITVDSIDLMIMESGEVILVLFSSIIHTSVCIRYADNEGLPLQFDIFDCNNVHMIL